MRQMHCYMLKTPCSQTLLDWRILAVQVIAQMHAANQASRTTLLLHKMHWLVCTLALHSFVRTGPSGGYSQTNLE